jgi:hypothetical protein
MSVLTDFYNLDLDLADITEPNWRTPEAEREKIVDFFGKHAPEVLKYRTAAEIEALPKPVDGFEIIGTLGMYEQHFQISWFDSLDAFQFYVDYRRLRELIDCHLGGQKFPKGLIAWMQRIVRGFTQSILIGDNETKLLYSIGMFPEEEIDLAKHSILEGKSAEGLWNLAVYKLVEDLYGDIIGLIVERKIFLRRCEASDCDKIFVPRAEGRPQTFHSKTCYWRERSRKQRMQKTTLKR